MARLLKDGLLNGVCFECGKKVENDVICKDCIDAYRKKLFGFKFESDWIEDLLWCPTQIYRKFSFDNNNYMIYMRWRSADPFRFHIWLIGTEFDQENKTNLPIVAWSEDLFEKYNIFASEKDDIKDIEKIVEQITINAVQSGFKNIVFNSYAHLHLKDHLMPKSLFIFCPVEFFIGLKKNKEITTELYYTVLEGGKFYRMSSIRGYNGKEFTCDKLGKFRIVLSPETVFGVVKSFSIDVYEVDNL